MTEEKITANARHGKLASKHVEHRVTQCIVCGMLIAYIGDAIPPTRLCSACREATK